MLMATRRRKESALVRANNIRSTEDLFSKIINTNLHSFPQLSVLLAAACANHIQEMGYHPKLLLHPFHLAFFSLIGTRVLVEDNCVPSLGEPLVVRLLLEGLRGPTCPYTGSMVQAAYLQMEPHYACKEYGNMRMEVHFSSFSSYAVKVIFSTAVEAALAARL